MFSGQKKNKKKPHLKIKTLYLLLIEKRTLCYLKKNYCMYLHSYILTFDYLNSINITGVMSYASIITNCIHA